ncbi:MAG: DegT/DnrJ/EryC1/StrS family aminotransferase [Rickettsiales bacterium]|jgi:dTDP-4-amino-4,6-dideoxygalactose transaminase|nr:DegT/DnrJ/EryC1/StrS family aminotransferase [Rickettsiales bacterium]
MAIQLFVPAFRIDETLAEIRECLEKGWTGLGFKTVELEGKWREYTGLPNAHFLNSATAGLDLAVRVLKMRRGWVDGDEVISSPMTFVSTNHVILYNNMKPVFADVDEYLCLDPKSVAARITPKTRAVMFVGIGGNVGRLREMEKICADKKLALIIDAAHMSGTRWRDGTTPGAGSADAIVYSYQAVKNMPTADSGMVCFRDPADDDLVRKLSWLGINKDTYARSINAKAAYKWRYDVEHVGYKDNGNAVMAAIGLVSLRYLDRDNAYRRQLAEWYDEGFGGVKNVMPVPHSPECSSSRHLYQIAVDNRDELLMALNDVDIYPGVHYLDNTNYKMYSYAAGTCPNSHKASGRIMSLPMHINLSKADVDYIVENVRKYAK